MKIDYIPGYLMTQAAYAETANTIRLRKEIFARMEKVEMVAKLEEGVGTFFDSYNLSERLGTGFYRERSRGLDVFV